MPTPDLFDFDEEDLADYDKGRVRDALVDYPAIYVSHLQIAQHLHEWADRLSNQKHSGDTDGDSHFANALLEVAAHLRQGDYVPTGAFIREQRDARDRKKAPRDGPKKPRRAVVLE